MNRRTLFGRLATVAAAATVAAHVEPARADGDLGKYDAAVSDYESYAGHERWIQDTPEFQEQVRQLATNLYIECDLGGATADDAIPLAFYVDAEGGLCLPLSDEYVTYMKRRAAETGGDWNA